MAGPSVVEDTVVVIGQARVCSGLVHFAECASANDVVRRREDENVDVAAEMAGLPEASGAR